MAEVNKIEELKLLYSETSLFNYLTIRKEDEYPKKGFSALRFDSNNFRIRAIEIWDHKEGRFFRVYHAPDIINEIKTEVNLISGKFRSSKKYTDFRGDFHSICQGLVKLLSNEELIKLALSNPILTKNSAYEGLVLPDIDISESDVFGRVFNWKEIIAISEDTSEDNKMKEKLSQSGVYLQRSLDGSSRYVGSAYSEGGILSRWLKHLNSNGDAKHLNLYVLENGYNNMFFTVLQFTNKEDAINSETLWKTILGSKNSDQYDQFRLNKN